MKHSRAFVVSLGIAIATVAGAQTKYRVTDLGDLNGGPDLSYATDVSPDGLKVTGDSYVDAGIIHGFYWDRANGMLDLGDLTGGANESHGYGVRNSGEVVGNSISALGSEAYRWNGSFTILPDLPGGPVAAVAHKVNESGIVAGMGNRGDVSGVIWDANNAYTDLGQQFGVTFSVALHVNDLGFVTGFKGTVTNQLAFFYKPGLSVFDIGDFAGGQSRSHAYASNASEVVVGFGNSAAGQRAFSWTLAGGLVDLSVPGTSIANDINDSNTIVGSTTQGGVSKAWVKAPLELPKYLNDVLDSVSSGWNLRTATAISNNGVIVGEGVTPDGKSHAYIAEPVAAFERVLPHGFTVDLGRLNLGALEDLFVADNSPLQVCKFFVPNQQSPYALVTVNGTSPDPDPSVAQLTFRIRSFHAGAFQYKVSAMDDALLYRVISTRSLPLTYELVTLDLEPAAEYVRANGDVSCRFEVRQVGPSASVLPCFDLDQALWDIVR